jgi:hypothetical protein
LAARQKAAADKRCARHYPLEHFKTFARIPRFSTGEFRDNLTAALALYDLTSEDLKLV